MALAVDRLGSTYRAHRRSVDPDQARAYAAATNDDNPAYRSGALAPPLFGAVVAWDALAEAVADVVPAAALGSVVHAEHDMHFRFPLRCGAVLDTGAEPYSFRGRSSGTFCTVRLTSTDAGSGQVVLEQYATLFVRELAEGPDAGPDKPGHAFPDDARSREVGRHRAHVDHDQTYRYRDASGDRMALHVDEQAARRAGLPGIVVHGLCTMAMVGQAVVATVADGDPARLRRLAVRLADSVFPGSDLGTTIYAVSERAPDPAGSRRQAYAFEAHSDGRLVVTNGRAEVQG